MVALLPDGSMVTESKPMRSIAAKSEPQCCMAAARSIGCLLAPWGALAELLCCRVVPVLAV
mgnify:CR=1 FL=1